MAIDPRFVLSSLLLVAGCAGGGGGGGGGGPVDPPTGPTAFTRQAGLDSVAPGPGELRIDFTPPPTAAFEVAAFVSTNRATLFTSTPRVPAGGATTLTVAGLTDGSLHFVGLGIRPTTGGAYQQTGPTLTATPGTPLFVTSGAAGGGDGSQGNPYTLLEGVLNAFGILLGNPGTSVNLWLAGGDYAITSTLPVAAGVSIYGGFGPTFDLASRDLTNTPTVWRVAAGQTGMFHSDEQQNSILPVIVDGVRITGNGAGRIGIDTNGTDPTALELRSVIVTDMADRGLRLRNADINGFDIVLTNCQSSRNGGDGLNGSGNFDYSVYNCVFASNVQEGLDLNDLSVEAAGTATCNITSSQFFGNGAEGVDCTLGTPLVPSSGDFQVTIRGCAFERNAGSGCLVDADFELQNGYSADVQLRECLSRGNAAHGVHLDLDGPLDPNEGLTATVERLLSTSNALDGLYVTSESRPGLLVVSGTALVGNVGVGLRVEGPVGSAGNRSVALTHCLLASNFGGGMISRDVPASATSTIAYRQANPFDANTVQESNVISNDPLALAFVRAPFEYARVVSRSGTVLTLAGVTTSAAISDDLELADDGAERVALSVVGAQITLDAAPDDFGVPGLLAFFAPGTDVSEDYTLAGGSIALGAGLNGLDAGLLGSPSAGPPGVADEQPDPLLFPLETTPALSATVGANQSLVIAFSKSLNAASVNATTVAVTRGGNPLSFSVQTSGANLTVNPPGGGWGAGDFQLELDGLRATDGTELSAALVLPFSR